MTKVDWSTFLAVFNDLEKYPSMGDVAVALDVSYQTVRNKSSVYRAKTKQDPSLPAIIDRREVTTKTIDELSPRDHAQMRAKNLSTDILDIVSRSQYPLINPEAIVVESHMVRKWSRSHREYVLVEGTPRTWLSDTLKVAPVANSRNKKFIFTGAQNDAEAHDGFLENLEAYAADIGAKLVVGPWTYETQWWSENNPTSRAYDPALEQYLCFGQMKIGDNFVFCGEMNTLPTASAPISDLVTYSRGRWAVFPHAKRQLKSVPSTDPNQQAHQVMTTGAVTRPKVIPRKAGVKSIFHHVLGAVVVEFDKDGDVFARHVTASNEGAFYDLDCYVAGGKVVRGRHRAKSIVFPDIHERKLTPRNTAAIFGFNLKTGAPVKGSVLDLLDPEHALIHDLYDNEYRNHHHINDNAYSYELAFRGRDYVLDEIKGAARFLRLIRRKRMQIHVIDSNHDLALERYVREGRYRNDGKNIRLGLQLEDAYLGYRERVAKALDAYLPTPKFSLLEYAIRTVQPKGLESVSWVYDGESFVIDGVECGHHGFRGANGAKGTVAGFARLGKKMSIADKHQPEICEGVYVAGCMELHHGYNKGPSGWAVSVIVQYPDGKRALITLQKGKFRA